MNRLLPELDRLYGRGPTAMNAPTADDAGGEAALSGLRVAVLEVALPTGWAELSAVWKGAQSDFGLPAPAIAVSGTDGLQLWFSFASPTSPQARARFLRGLHERYLPGVAARQVRRFAEAAELPAAPPVAIGPQQWSAFVTPDLASVFADTPWLDIPPTDEGQAAILRALAPMPQAAFEAALATLASAAPTAVATHADPTAAMPPAPTAAPNAARWETDPARFLIGVMNDETAPLALRIDAAKSLLPYAHLITVSAPK